MTTVAAPLRRLALAAGLLTVALISCGREVTGPGKAPVNAFKRFASFSFAPQYETAVPGAALRAALTQVAFEKVRITLRREDGTIALDTVVDFPVGADSLTLSFNVPLPANAPATGVPLSLNLNYVNAAGDTVFKGGPLAITVTPSTGGAPPPPVQVPVHYTGTGANATGVVITPNAVNGLAGQVVTFSAIAVGANGQTIAGTPIVFTSANPNIVLFPSATSGIAQLIGRGTTTVSAQLLTGPQDAATVTVTLPAARLALTSGGNQTAPAGTNLPLLIVAKVAASDGIGVAGVTVNFAVTSGGGSVAAGSAVSASDGSVSTTWKLGVTPGAQSLTLTAAGLTGSPLVVSATALSVTPTKLAVTTQPASAKAGGTLGNVTVAAQDANGVTVATFTGDITVGMGTNPGAATLSGTTTVKAVNGVATFSDLSLDKPATGYTLAFASSGLAGASSSAFDVTVGAAAKLSIGTLPAFATAGSSITPAVVVRVLDGLGNQVSNFTGTVTVALGTNPKGGVLSGTVSRNAVAGVATFNDLAIKVAAVGYTITATSPSLTAGSSSAFTVLPGDPVDLKVVRGDAQSRPVGTMLDTIVVRLVDAFDNAVPGRAVTFAVTGGGGSASALSPTTDAQGEVRVLWTVGSGPQALTASFGGVPLLTVKATGTAGAATQLVIVTPGLPSAVSGAPGTVVVHAKDAAGNLATSFTGVVTAAIASGPAGATVSGPTTATAVAGVATFSGVSLDKAGTYTVTFSATGLSSVTSPSFVVSAGAATNIEFAAVSGNSQSAATGAALASPIRVKVTDTYGNAVLGTTIAWSVTSGGGSVSPATSTTDALGEATTTWTMGAAPGTNGAQAESGGLAGLTGSPVAFTATATAGAATQLVITQQPPTTSVARVAFTPALTVVAKDAGGNVASSFTGTVAVVVGTNPAAGTLSGTMSVAAVAGTATFANLSLDKVGTGYTLVFSASPLTSATSTAISITPAAASQIFADSGLSQNGSAGQPLPAALVVKVTDAYGNKVSGAGVTWAVASGGGTLANTTTLTDVSGKARAQWTLGLTVGTQSVTATSALLTGSPVTFTATGNAVGYNKIWTGTTSTDWNTATNWSPAGVPAATDSVQIDLVTNQPQLAASTTIAHLTTAIGTTLTIGSFDLSVAGTVNTGGSSAVSGAGKLILTGTSGTIVGPSFPYVKVLGAYSLSGSVGFFSSVEIASGSLNTNGHTANITGDLITSGTGTIAMTSASDVFNVSGNVSLGGGNVTLSTGELRVGGNFAQTTGTFAQSGGFTQFVGTAVKTISFSDATATSYFKSVIANGAGTINLSTAIRIAGGLELLSGAGDIVGVGKAVRAMGLTIDLAVPRQLQVDTLDLWSPGTVALPSAFQIAVINVTGAGVNLGNGVSLDGQLRITGNGILGLNGNNVSVTNSLVTADNGRLQMNGAETLTVNGDVTFGGGSTSGLLTNGQINVRGNFSQSGNAQAFAASGSHIVHFDGTAAANQGITFANPDSSFGTTCSASCFANVTTTKIAGQGGILINTAMKAVGNIDFTGTGDTVSVGLPAPSNRIVVAGGNFSAGAAMQRFSRVAFGGTFGDGIGVLIDTLIYAGANQTLKPNDISRVSNVRVSGSGNTLISAGSGQYTHSVIIDGATAVLEVTGTGAPAQLLGSVKTQNGGRLKMTDATDTLYVSNIDFSGGSTTGMLTAGALQVVGNFSSTGSAFDASGSHVVTLLGGAVAQTLSGDPGSTSVGFQQLWFEGSMPKTVSMSGGFAFNVKGKLVLRSGSGTVSGTGQIWMKSGSAVYDSTAAGNSLQIARLSVAGVTALPKKLAVGDLMIESGSQSLSDSINTTSSVTVNGSGGELELNGKRLRLTGTNAGFSTQNGGRLKMTKPADSLVVENANSITFGGGSTNGRLTDGTIIATGNFTQSGDPAAFAATSNHETKIFGTSTKTVKFGNPGLTTTTSHFATLTLADTNASGTTLASDVYAVAKLQTAGTFSLTWVRDGAYAANAAPTLHAADINSTAFTTFDRVMLHIYNAGASTSFSNATFQNFASNSLENQLTVEGTGTVAMSNLTFSTSSANTYNYVYANNLGAGLTLELTNMSPPLASVSGKLTVSGTPLAIINWSSPPS